MAAQPQAERGRTETWTWKDSKNRSQVFKVCLQLCRPWPPSLGRCGVEVLFDPGWTAVVDAHRGTMAIAPMYDNYDGAFYQCDSQHAMNDVMHDVMMPCMAAGLRGTKSFELFGGTHEDCRNRFGQESFVLSLPAPCTVYRAASKVRYFHHFQNYGEGAADSSDAPSPSSPSPSPSSM